MEISKLLKVAAVDAASINENTTTSINTPVEHNGRQVYRSTYYLAFKTDPTADGIVIDKSQSRLGGTVDSYTHNLTPSDSTYQRRDWEALNEKSITSPDLVKIKLIHPWSLSSISTNDDRGVEVLRLDGEALSTEPTITGNANTLLSDDFVGQDFALRKVAHIAGKPGQVLKAEKKAAMGGEKSVANKLAQSASKPVQAAPLHGITHIAIKSYPTGPRIGLGKIGEIIDSEIEFSVVWQEAGEQRGVPVDLLPEDTDQDAFHSQLQQICNDYFSDSKQNELKIPPTLFVPVVFESDTPVRLRLNEINIAYCLRRNHFDDAKEKQNVKFGGDIVEEKIFSISLPIGSSINKAELAIHVDLSKVFDMSENSKVSGVLNRSSGIRVKPGEPVSCKISLSTAATIDNMSLALMPLNDKVDITVQIIKNANDGPNGVVLAKTSLHTELEYQQQWFVAYFDQLALLDSGEYWLQLSSQEGELIWLGEEATAAQVCIAARKMSSLAPLYGVGLVQAGLSSNLGSSFGYALDLRVGSEVAELVNADGAKLTYDFTVGLGDSLASSSEKKTKLSLISGSAGSVTVYPPEISFEV